MKIKHLTYLEKGDTYQTPAIQTFSLLVEQTVLNGSTPDPLDTNAPEGYNVDEDEVNW